MNISDVTHHDLPRLTHPQRVQLARHYKVELRDLPARLALRVKLRKAHAAYRQRLFLANQPQPDAHIYRCTCGAWTTGYCATCAIWKLRGTHEH